jgi:hypothetical protein
MFITGRFFVYGDQESPCKSAWICSATNLEKKRVPPRSPWQYQNPFSLRVSAAVTTREWLVLTPKRPKKPAYFPLIVHPIRTLQLLGHFLTDDLSCNPLRIVVKASSEDHNICEHVCSIFKQKAVGRVANWRYAGLNLDLGLVNEN